jgi:hypothetical protein
MAVAREVAASRVVDAGHQHHELIPAEPGDGVTGPHTTGESCRYLAEQLVTVLMAVSVVDLLNASKSRISTATRLVGAAGVRQCMVESVQQQPTIRQTRRRIMPSGGAQLGFQQFAVGDIQDAHRPAADAAGVEVIRREYAEHA